jgi:hypothetical protein
MRIECVGAYSHLLKDIAKGMALGDDESIRIGARLLAQFVKADSAIVPMPGHLGWADWSLTLAYAMKQNVYACVMNCLSCEPHDRRSSQVGWREPPIMTCHLGRDNLAWINKSAQSLVVIDNVVTTGGTASAAVKALVEAGVNEEKIVVLALCQAKLRFK